MNYERKYKDALERAREQYNKRTPLYDIESIFPELQEKESEDERIKQEIIAYINELADLKNEKIPTKWLDWLKKQRDYIKLPNFTYSSNKDINEFADKYSHIVWEKLMNNFKKIENYSIGCNDVSDIVLNAIINTYIWLKGQGQIKESHISQHESKTCEENNEFLTNDDERIKETLKGFVKGYSAFINGQWRLGDFTVNRIVDWLEKHGKQNPVEWSEEDEKIKESIKKHIFNADDWYVSKVDGKIHNMTYNPTDKVEPKFKVGDWIAVNDGIFKITQYEDEYGYELTDTNGCVVHFVSPDYVESNFHRWTIADAKGGDVLVNGSNIFIFHFINDTRLMGYCHVNIDNGRFYDDIGKNECFCLIDAIVTPATKEQRNLLFQKMKEAGYEWDSENKELKKIEPKTLYADKVIAWLNENVADFWANPCNPQNVINQFKKDFGL